MIKISAISALFAGGIFFVGPSQLLAGGDGYHDLFYRGVYQVRQELTDGLDCRSAPSRDAEALLNYPSGKLIRSQSLSHNRPAWFKTADGCHVRANTEYLRWQGEGEDPSSMCNPLIEPC